MTDGSSRRHEIIVLAVILLLAVAVTLGSMWYSRRKTEEYARDTSYIPKATKITPEVELLQKYISIDTSNPPGNELPAAQWLAHILEANGVKPEIIESAPRRANLYARIKGKRPGEGLLLLHHMDVYPVDPGKWKRPAFSGEIWLNQLYGRGTIDMKGMGICELLAFIDVARSGRTPEHDLVFLAVADEESGSALGMAWLLEHRPDVIDGVRYALNEGGITEMLQEKVTYFGIEIGTKQSVTLLLHARSRESLQRVRILLEPYFFGREPHRITPEVKRWMKSLAPQRVDFRESLGDVDRAVASGDFWRLPTGYREMTQDNVWADGVVQRGDVWEMRTYLLNLPDTDPDERIAWLREKIQPYGITYEIVRKEGPVPVTSDRTPFYELLTREAKRSFNAPAGTEILNKSFNDSRFLRKRGIAAYGITPMPIDFFQTETVHQSDERIRVDYFQQGVAFFRRLVVAYAFEAEVTQSVRNDLQKPSV